MRALDISFSLEKRHKVFLVLFSLFIFLALLYRSNLTISTDNAQLKVKNIKLFSVVEGEITDVMKEDGSFVEQNEPVFKINDIVYRNQLDSITAKRDYVLELYKKQKGLHDKKLISEIEFLQIKTQKEEAQSAFEIAKYMYDKAIAKSPIKGILTNFNLKKGDTVSKATFLGNIIDCTDVWVEANFKETDARYIKKGSKAVVVIDYDKSKKFKASVVDVSNAVNSEFSLLPSQNISGNWIKVTQRLRVKLRFDNIVDDQCKFFKSGLNTEVKIFK